MNLILLPNLEAAGLERYYVNALTKAVELYIVSAYLTEWDAPRELGRDCLKFRFIVGRDFGITRKKACRDVLTWLPARMKHTFLIAAQIDGFHPKAMFWSEGHDSFHSLVGSSNLTRAAFSTNHEANVYQRLSEVEFRQACNWIQEIELSCVPVSEDWLARYREAPRKGPVGPNHKSSSTELCKALKLPRIKGAMNRVRERREQLDNHLTHKAGLIKLFKACAAGQLSSAEFYNKLPSYWSVKLNNRLQGPGWERQGKRSDFQKLSQSFLQIVDAKAADRDDVVAEQIDWLHREKVQSRAAFLSEMLCLQFPTLYPVKNQPVTECLGFIRSDIRRRLARST